MTFSRCELEKRGVDEQVREWRKWRRSMYLTIAEAAACADVRRDTLQRVEIGDFKPGPETRAKLAALMARWDESKRPKRKPDGRGRWPRKRKETA